MRYPSVRHPRPDVPAEDWPPPPEAIGAQLFFREVGKCMLAHHGQSD